MMVTISMILGASDVLHGEQTWLCVWKDSYVSHESISMAKLTDLYKVTCSIRNFIVARKFLDSKI